MPPARLRRFGRTLGGVAVLCLWCSILVSEAQQDPPVTIQINYSPQNSNAANGPTVPAQDTVVWLTQRGDPQQGASGDAEGVTKARARITQHNKQFEPHVQVVQVGTVIDFPNRDPFFHNVFSLFDGKRFDLGLYEAGSTNSVKFDRVGVSFLFCNIHPEMSAVVITVDTPYYTVTDHSGHAVLTNVPDGPYELHVWSERAQPEDLKKPRRIVGINATSRNLPPLLLADNPNFSSAHKNKYGQDYVPPPSNSYSH